MSDKKLESRRANNRTAVRQYRERQRVKDELRMEEVSNMEKRLDIVEQLIDNLQNELKKPEHKLPSLSPSGNSEADTQKNKTTTKASAAGLSIREQKSSSSTGCDSPSQSKKCSPKSLK